MGSCAKVFLGQMHSHNETPVNVSSAADNKVGYLLFFELDVPILDVQLYIPITGLHENHITSIISGCLIFLISKYCTVFE